MCIISVGAIITIANFPPLVPFAIDYTKNLVYVETTIKEQVVCYDLQVVHRHKIADSRPLVLILD